MAKGSLAVAAFISIHFDLPDVHILDWLADPSPTLKGFTLAVETVLRSYFPFTLDFRQFQDHNRHDRLLVSGDLLQSPSYKKLVLFSISCIPPTMLQSPYPIWNLVLAKN